MKKGQGLSLNVIIIAAIALIVLVVLVAIFTGRMGTWTESLRREETKYCGPVPAGKTGTSVGGTVKSTSAGCGDLETQVYGIFQDVAVNRICCVPE
ncbi:hypothetical protein KY360_00545 [Candidatus Woesearchaeota archaeon]|nr:hypothetical protein [Candidatus Woesearchaeota archaeon]